MTQAANKSIKRHVSKDSKKFGPYEIETLCYALKRGVLLPSDLVWSHELPNWLPITEVVAV
jgi:GYF domain 2